MFIKMQLKPRELNTDESQFHVHDGFHNVDLIEHEATVGHCPVMCPLHELSRTGTKVRKQV